MLTCVWGVIESVSCGHALARCASMRARPVRTWLLDDFADYGAQDAAVVDVVDLNAVPDGLAARCPRLDALAQGEEVRTATMSSRTGLRGLGVDGQLR